MENYDAVVIGAGNGGLVSALSLSKQGLNVLLLEKHNVPGGCATSFTRGRFEFEVSLHQVNGIGSVEQPGPLRMLFDELGVMNDVAQLGVRTGLAPGHRIEHEDRRIVR